ncbi:VWA domain-containing protein [Candidatus Woesearchaeota archaeon]|nr:VWA domain-containing protein [Candidatus Woesearchaeota archaeon]
MEFENPQLTLLIIPVLAALVAVIRKDFGKMKKIQERRSFQSRLRQRSILLVSRSLIFILLVLAMASPFSLQTVIKTGDPTVTLLIDNSTSMNVLDTSGIDDLEKELKKSIPVSSKTFASGEISAIGDALIISIDGDDNILLVSDGNSNHGRSLGDMLVLASTLNATINAVDLQVNKDDTSVLILGPRITTNAEENDFDVAVSQNGMEKDYLLIVSVDGQEVLSSTYSGSNMATITKKFSDGYHIIKAEIVLNDFFKRNNVFYKTVKVEPKPKVLLVRGESTPLSDIMTSLYHTTTATSISGENLGSYSAVILNDIPASELDVERLSSYVIDGNGMVVFGGKNSYDRGGYKDSLFEGMLPVMVGRGKEGERTDVNIALVIDISQSTAAGFRAGASSRVEEVEKALAVGVLEGLRKNDKVTAIAFNTQAFIVSDLARVLENEDYVKSQISKLVYKGGTRIDEGIKAARKILGPLDGSKNIIIFSDGKSGSYSEDLRDAQIAANAGIKIYTIGVGEGTNRKHMQDIANAGNGYYFEPDETERLKVIFGEAEEMPGTSAFSLEIINSHHFVTQGLKVSANVNGFNQVVPKPNADLLVATQNNNPILTVSRLGLGRIVAVSTDDGSAWSPELLASGNSVLITRAVNWAVGDLSRNKEFDVDVKDVYLGEAMMVNVIAGSFPEHENMEFAKIGKRLYTASYVPEAAGLYSFFDATAAVNYEREYAALGVNPDLERALGVTGGKLFSQNDAEAIVEKVKEDSKRIIASPVSYSWLLLMAALFVFLAEVAFRKVQEGKTDK